MGRERDRANRKLFRKEIYSKYGDVCNHCGENNKAFLTIDHIESGSASKVGDGKNLAQWLIKSGFPSGFQILCWNCNRKKHFEGLAAKGYRHPKMKENQNKIKKLLLDHYGSKCNCCGIADIFCLAIDHLDPKMKKADWHPRWSGNTFYQWLKKNNFPPGFQTLCHNCNFGKHVYGVCPHQLR